MSRDPYENWGADSDEAGGDPRDSQGSGGQRRSHRSAQAADSWPGGYEDTSYPEQSPRGQRGQGGQGGGQRGSGARPSGSRHGAAASYSRADDYGRSGGYNGSGSSGTSGTSGSSGRSGSHRSAADYGEAGYPGGGYLAEDYPADGYGDAASSGPYSRGGYPAADGGDARPSAGSYPGAGYRDGGYGGGQYPGLGPPDISSPGASYRDDSHPRGGYPADDGTWNSPDPYAASDAYRTDPYGQAGNGRSRREPAYDDPGSFGDQATFGGGDGYGGRESYGGHGGYEGADGYGGPEGYGGSGSYAAPDQYGEPAGYGYGGGYEDEGTGPVRGGLNAGAAGSRSSADDRYDWQAPVNNTGVGAGGGRIGGRERDREPDLDADDPRHNHFFRGFGGGDDDDDYGHGKPRKRRSKAGLVALCVLVLFLVAVVGGGVYGYRWYSKRHADWTGSAGYGSVLVTVASGEFACSPTLENTLVSKGVVASATAFCDAAKANAGNLEPGTFKLKKHMGAALAWALLLNPKSRDQLSVTIPDGLRYTKILPLLATRTGIPLSKFQAAIQDTSALGLPSWAKGNPEGFLYPDTYPVQPGTTALQILQTMVHQFNVQATGLNLAAAAHKALFTEYQVITEASLLEAEVPPQYYTKVARVIDNRLNQIPPMDLGLDSTVAYATGAYIYNLTQKDLDSSSPYNTTNHAGLPPGPIDSPDAAAIEAVLHPAKGTWLYFVTVSKSGLTKFTTSAAQFNVWANQAKAAGI